MADKEWELPEKKCSICGKMFVPAPQHIYKKGSTEWCCTYTCYMELERRIQWLRLSAWARNYEKKNRLLHVLSVDELERGLSTGRYADRMRLGKYINYRKLLELKKEERGS